MNVTFETLAVLSVILPGFLASAVLNTIVVRKPLDAFTKLFEALAFSATIYCVPFVMYAFGGIEPENFGYVVFVVLALTAAIPLIVGASITHDFHMGILRKLRITDKTARDTVWFDVFTDISKRYVVVNFRDGRRIMGWPQYYANTPEEGTLYLFDPYWIDNNGENVPLDRHGILITKETIETIEFLKETSGENGEDSDKA